MAKRVTFTEPRGSGSSPLPCRRPCRTGPWVEHHMRVALVVGERDDRLGHADLVGVQAGRFVERRMVSSRSCATWASSAVAFSQRVDSTVSSWTSSLIAIRLPSLRRRRKTHVHAWAPADTHACAGTHAFPHACSHAPATYCSTIAFDILSYTPPHIGEV